jgi:hypothetical protein
VANGERHGRGAPDATAGAHHRHGPGFRLAHHRFPAQALRPVRQVRSFPFHLARRAQPAIPHIPVWRPGHRSRSQSAEQLPTFQGRPRLSRTVPGNKSFTVEDVSPLQVPTSTFFS